MDATPPTTTQTQRDTGVLMRCKNIQFGSLLLRIYYFIYYYIFYVSIYSSVFNVHMLIKIICIRYAVNSWWMKWKWAWEHKKQQFIWNANAWSQKSVNGNVKIYSISYIQCKKNKSTSMLLSVYIQIVVQVLV